jgi:hypothetical protein
MLIFIFFTSCTNVRGFDSWDNDDEDCDYYNCNTVEPFDAVLNIKFTRNNQNQNPIIFVKTGYYEDGVVCGEIKTDTVNGDIAHIREPLDFNYSVYTIYKRGNDTILVIDGAYVHKIHYQECDSTCWQIKNANFNLKLK